MSIFKHTWEEAIGATRFKDHPRMVTHYEVTMDLEEMANAREFKQHLYRQLIDETVAKWIADCYPRLKDAIDVDAIKRRIEDAIVESMADYMKKLGESLARDTTRRITGRNP